MWTAWTSTAARNLRFSVSATAVLLAGVLTPGFATAQDAQRSLIIQNVRIFDGVRVLPERAVLC